MTVANLPENRSKLCFNDTIKASESAAGNQRLYPFIPKEINHLKTFTYVSVEDTIVAKALHGQRYPMPLS